MIMSHTKLKEFMDFHGISVKELSEILGVSLKCVYFWLSGERVMSLTTSKLIRLFSKYPKLIREF